MKKSKTIIFRVSEETYATLENIAGNEGPNDWCREIVMQKIAAKEISAAPSSIENIVFEEIAKLRYLVGIGFGLLSTGELTKESWNHTKQLVDEKGKDIADALLKRRDKS